MAMIQAKGCGFYHRGKLKSPLFGREEMDTSFSKRTSRPQGPGTQQGPHASRDCQLRQNLTPTWLAPLIWPQTDRGPKRSKGT